jgi:hypothetical protein
MDTTLTLSEDDAISRAIADGNNRAAMRMRADLAEQRLLNLRAVLRDMREQTGWQPEHALPERTERKGWLSFRRAG